MIYNQSRNSCPLVCVKPLMLYHYINNSSIFNSRYFSGLENFFILISFFFQANEVFCTQSSNLTKRSSYRIILYVYLFRVYQDFHNKFKVMCKSLSQEYVYSILFLKLKIFYVPSTSCFELFWVFFHAS